MIKTLEGPTRMVQQQFTSFILIFHANEFFENGHFGDFVKNRGTNLFTLFTYLSFYHKLVRHGL